MAEQLSRCRGIGALAALWDRERQTDGKAPSGLRVLVDLDEGTVSRVTWNAAGFETTGDPWQGRGVLEGLLQAIVPLFDGDSASARAFLLDADAMAGLTENVNDALFDDLDDASIELNGRAIGFRQLLTDMQPLNEAIRDLAGHASSCLPDTEDAYGSLILYGTCAAFKPLQILFRSAFHESDTESFLPLAVMEDSLFAYVSDDGGLASVGWQLLDSGAVSSGPPTSPADLTLLLTDGDGKDIVFPLSVRGQTAEQLSPETPPFFLAPDSVLRLSVNGTSRTLPLPGSFLRTGCVAAARAVLEGRSLALRLKDVSDPKITHSLNIDTEVQ